MDRIGTQQERMQRNEDRKRRGLPHLTPQEFKSREDSLMGDESYKWDQPVIRPLPTPVPPRTPDLRRQKLMVDAIREGAEV